MVQTTTCAWYNMYKGKTVVCCRVLLHRFCQESQAHFPAHSNVPSPLLLPALLLLASRGGMWFGSLSIYQLDCLFFLVTAQGGPVTVRQVAEVHPPPASA